MNNNVDKKIRIFLDKYYLNDATDEECPDEETLFDFAEGNLSESRRNEILKHLSYCKRCNKILKLYTEIPNEEAEEVPAHFSEKVMKEIFRYKKSDVKKFVIKLLEKSFEIIETFKGVNYQLVPTPAYRGSTEKEKIVTIDFTENGYDIKARISHQTENKISVELNILKNKYPLSDAVITLYKMDNNIEDVLESQNTNINGSAQFRNLNPDIYMFEIGEDNPVKFEVELKNGK